ncbi:hypothetical protein ONE63_006816 [Megalurothrips usitatus]|uniref:RIIa domain-containing protein n=1 Tax=Megalurothrips usitatus TaxID=439358 RepID=A0AAV7XUA9_9NEOP|nr:hypothetical protein ONE63_006816 [Megalurothrips usitatus]
MKTATSVVHHKVPRPKVAATKVAGFTAEGVFVKLSVPEGMDAALQGLTREVLRHQPDDIYWFAAQYFENLIRARGGGRVEEFTAWQETRTSKRSSQSSTFVSSTQQDVSGSGIAALAATTGTVAVLATASASQRASWDGADQVEERVSKSSSHSSTSNVVTRSETLHSVRMEHTGHQDDSPRGSDKTGGSSKTSKKRLAKKDKARKDKESKSASSSSQEIESDSSKSAKTGSLSPKGVITKQVDTIVKGLAHDTVITAEEISKKTAEKSSVIHKDGELTEMAIEKSESVQNDITRPKRSTRKLKRQTKSVDSASFSDRSENGDTQLRGAARSGIATETNETSVVGSHTETANSHGITLSTTAKEIVELQQLKEWVDGADHSSQTKSSDHESAPERVENSTSQADKVSSVPPEPNFTHYETAYVITNEVIGENPSDIKSEELRVLSEGSVRKSSAHDIREETGEDGSHLTTEEKAEETKEEKHEATEKTVLERKSNVQVGENGDIVEEEITITRTEQSSKTETTVSKSWTMETTIETLADGETRVIERMILHSPPHDEGEKDEAVVKVEGEKQTQLHHQENVNTKPDDVPTKGKQMAEEELASRSSEVEAIAVGHEILTEEIDILKDNHEPTITTNVAVGDAGRVPTEHAREFGLIDAEEAKKSIEHITVALEKAENSLNVLQQDAEVHDVHESKTETVTIQEDEVKLSEKLTTISMPTGEHRRDALMEASVPVDEDGHEVTKAEFGLIDAEEAKKSLEQISVALIRAEESIDALQSHENVLVRHSVENEELDSAREEVNEDGKVERKNEFGLIDPEEAKKSLEEIAVAISKAEDSLDTLQSGGMGVQEKHAIVVEGTDVVDTADGHHHIPSEDNSLQKAAADATPPMRTEVDENGKEITHMSSHAADTVIEGMPTDDSSIGGKEGGHGDQSSVTVHTTVIENIDLKTEDLMIPLDEIDAEKASEVSKEGSKEETSKLKGHSSQAPDSPTDEDQATPRDEVESLRVDTPEDSSATKSSSGSDENGDPINPPTVVISRTADVIELKDGEVNIVTQMEKEGLVEDMNNEEPMERIITKGVLQTLAEENMEHQSNSNITAKVAGLTVVAATVGFITSEKGETTVVVDRSLIEGVHGADEGDTLEVLAGGFDSNQFIHEESKHTSWLLQSPLLVTSGLGETTGHEVEVLSTIKVHEVGHIEEEGVRADGDTSKHKIEHTSRVVGDEKPDPHVEEAPVAKRTVEHQESGVSSVDESRDTEKSLRSMSPELDENGKPVPVDENGKPMYNIRKKRSLQTKRSVSLANDIIPDKSHVKLSRTGSLVGADDSTDHWYGSQISSTGSTLIKPVLAMARDPAIATLKPCEEPECVAVDVRNTKEDSTEATRSEGHVINEGFDVMREMSLVTSRIGQSILSLGPEKSEVTLVGTEDEPKHVRSDSQESFIISEGAVYIPLNPPGMKQPSLERIDSVPSILESPHDATPPIEKEVFAAGLNLSFEEVSTHDAPEVVGVTNAAVTVSPATYTVTEPVSDAGHVDNESRDGISEENQDDDVLIVEYPMDPNAKVTKWDNVVVTSPADMKEVHKDDAVHPLESIPMEGQSHISMDDSLQEVPSLQDEAVGHIDSESELLDSMPEDEMERKWTDDVAMVAGKAKGMVKGIFGQQNRSIGNEIEEAVTSHTGSVVSEAAKEVQSVNSVVHDIGNEVEATAHKASGVAANALKHNEEVKENVQRNVQASFSSLKENVASTANSLVSDIKHGVSGAENAAKSVADDVGEHIMSAKKEAEDTIENAVEGVEHATETAVDFVSNEAALVSDAASHSVTAAVEGVEHASDRVSNEIHTAVLDLKEKGNEAAADIADSVKSGVTGVKQLGAELEHSVGTMVADAKENISSTSHSLSEKVGHEVRDLHGSVSESVASIGKTGENIAENVKGKIGEAADDVVAEIHDVELTSSRILYDISSNVQNEVNSVSTHTADAVANVKDKVHEVSDRMDEEASAYVAKTARAVDDVKKNVVDARDHVETFAKDCVDEVAETGASVKRNVVEAVEGVNDGLASAADSFSTTASKTFSSINDEATKTTQTVEELGLDAKDNLVSVANSVSDRVTVGVESAEQDVEKAKDGATALYDDVAEGVKNMSTDVRDTVEATSESIQTAVGRVKRSAEIESENIQHTVDGEADAITSRVSTGVKDIESFAHRVESEADAAVNASVESAHREEKELQDTLSSISHRAQENAQGLARSAQDETVATLELAEASVQQALSHAEKTITAEAAKVLNVFRATDDGEHKVHAETEGAVPSSQDSKPHGESATDTTVHVLEQAEESVRSALNRAEETISAEAQKSLKFLTGVEHSSNKVSTDVATIGHEHDIAVESVLKTAEDTTVTTLKEAEESVQKALNQAEETISMESQKSLKFLADDANLTQEVESDKHKGSPRHEKETHLPSVRSTVEDVTVTTLDQAEESVRHALDRAEETISTEAQKSLKFLTGTGNSEPDVAAESKVDSPLDGQEAIHRSVLETAEDVTVTTLEQAEKSVTMALDKAEETISSEAKKSSLSLQETGGSITEIATTSKSETHHAEEESSTITVSTSHSTQDNTVTALERAEMSVKMALNRAEETIATEAMRAATVLHSHENIEESSTESSSQRIASESEERFEKTVSTATRVQRFSEGIHERVRREVSTLRDDHGHDAAVRRGRSTSDITVRKAPTKVDSWESNLRKSTVASSGKMARNATVSGGEAKKTQSHIPRSTRKTVTVAAHSDPHQKGGSVAEAAKKRPPLKKAKSLADDSSEEAKKRVKKMPSQGSTRKTAISVESAVEAAGETVVKRALEKAKSTPESAEDTSSETSKSTSLTTSSSTRHRRETHSSSSEEPHEGAHAVHTELVHAAATIQDAFRDLREHKVPVDENAREMPVPPRTSFQIEPVLEEIAEEVGGERRGSRQESQGADNEDTSSSESSLSSAATRIQAGYRGHLARRHRLHRHGTGGTTSMGTASTSVSMSMSRDSDVGVVRAMSLLEDSEVQRHQLDPLDQLPEADDQEYGPAKYVADVHRAHAEAHGGKKGVEWARSLDSGLSSGPERHTPVRTAVSVQQRALRDRDLDEHIWRTLEQDMLAGEAATDESEDAPRREGPRRMSTRRGLHRGNAMQLPTTSSSTPPSLEEPPQAAAGATARHTGEFHDMLVLPLHAGEPEGEGSPWR